VVVNKDLLVILTEDDEAAANLIKMNLSRAGLKNIHWAKNGKECIDFLSVSKNLKENPHIIVLLDINMPVMDGFDTLKKIKNESKLKHIPVIMLTTTDNPQEVNKCYELGCNFYIKKPVEYKAFMESLKSIANFARICILP
jgi:CheY-like chemotaxis protein